MEKWNMENWKRISLVSLILFAISIIICSIYEIEIFTILTVTTCGILGVMVYLLPIFIAYDKKLTNKETIEKFNLCLGWTIIGWVACLSLSLAEEEQIDFNSTTYNK